MNILQHNRFIKRNIKEKFKKKNSKKSLKKIFVDETKLGESFPDQQFKIDCYQFLGWKGINIEMGSLFLLKKVYKN